MAEVTFKVPSIILGAINYLKYPSTWKGIITVIAAGLAAKNPELVTQIATAGAGFVGIIGTFFSDADVKPTT